VVGSTVTTDCAGGGSNANSPTSGLNGGHSAAATAASTPGTLRDCGAPTATEEALDSSERALSGTTR